MDKNHYILLDHGEGRKLEQFGPYIISRPSSGAVWAKSGPDELWKKADASFTRIEENRWIGRDRLPQSWHCCFGNLTLKIEPTDFGHLGVFPEQMDFWKWIEEFLKKSDIKKKRVLNLFAYSGGSTLAAARAGAEVVHLDASKGMVSWARENALINHLEGAPIRWIIDDVMKFLAREKRRQSRYEAIILDPPTFGRGTKGEVFKIEEVICELLQSCRDLLSDTPLFILFTCHTPGFSPQVLFNLLHDATRGLEGTLECGEALIHHTIPFPSGAWARWHI